ncbi:MAG TPA: hypothetical protein VFQ24_18815 [Terriglobia bacterium]|nr:hypothetical protein [Terriglobia bacterium]
MALATEDRIGELLREKLKEEGVSGQVEKLELFATPEGVLAEIVLRDTSVLEEARKIVEDVEGRLESEGISLLPTVRALWQVEEVQRIEIPSPPDAPSDMVGLLFKGSLKSGARHQEVWVAVTTSALRVLRPLATSDQALAELVRAFLLHRLSIGGAGYWDPIREPRQEIDEGAALYLRWRPYEALKTSIDNVFNPSGHEIREKSVIRFVETVNFGKGTRKIRRFLDVLEDLPGPGGPYSRGEWLPTSNSEFYSMLLEQEKRELESYYLDQVAKAEKEFPPLKVQFPAVFN